MSKMYGKLPSELLYIDCEYTSYCLNEACAFIMGKLQDEERPNFKEQKGNFGSFSEMYKQIENK